MAIIKKIFNIKNNTYIEPKSFEIKAALFYFFAYRQYPITATECGAFYADFIAVKNKKLIEVEIKTSIADLKKDFTLKSKHDIYKSFDASKDEKVWIPRRFYICVPKTIQKAAETVLKSENQKYGLLIYKNIKETDISDRIFEMKSAGTIHHNCLTPEAIEKIACRMSRDLKNRYIQLVQGN